MIDHRELSIPMNNAGADRIYRLLSEGMEALDQAYQDRFINRETFRVFGSDYQFARVMDPWNETFYSVNYDDLQVGIETVVSMLIGASFNLPWTTHSGLHRDLMPYLYDFEYKVEMSYYYDDFQSGWGSKACMTINDYGYVSGFYFWEPFCSLDVHLKALLRQPPSFTSTSDDEAGIDRHNEIMAQVRFYD